MTFMCVCDTNQYTQGRLFQLLEKGILQWAGLLCHPIYKDLSQVSDTGRVGAMPVTGRSGFIGVKSSLKRSVLVTVFVLAQRSKRSCTDKAWQGRQLVHDPCMTSTAERSSWLELEIPAQVFQDAAQCLSSSGLGLLQKATDACHRLLEWLPLSWQHSGRLDRTLVCRGLAIDALCFWAAMLLVADWAPALASL